jgi:hypothetical protein
MLALHRFDASDGHEELTAVDLGYRFSSRRSGTRVTFVQIAVRYVGARVQQVTPARIGARMDRQTKFTLWVAFLVLFSYVVWFYLDCAMDETCHLVCRAGGRGGCYTQRTAPAELGR